MAHMCALVSDLCGSHICVCVWQTRSTRNSLAAELAELKSDHQVTYEKFQQEFAQHKSKMQALIESAKASEDQRKASEEVNGRKMAELSLVTRDAQSTVSKISAEWKEKQSLIHDAETAVVRNAQLEIENSQLVRTMADLKSELKKREKQVREAGPRFRFGDTR